jgi:hypothetical protein
MVATHDCAGALTTIRPPTLAHVAARNTRQSPVSVRSGRDHHTGVDRILLAGFDFADQGQDLRAEIFNLLLKVQEATQDQVDAALPVGGNALGNLLGRSDQTGAEAVVVLDQVLE